MGKKGDWKKNYDWFLSERDELVQQRVISYIDAWRLRLQNVAWGDVYMHTRRVSRVGLCYLIFSRWLRSKIIVLPDEADAITDKLNRKYNPRGFDVSGVVHVKWSDVHHECYRKDLFTKIELKNPIMAMVKVIKIEMDKQKRRGKI